MVGDPRHRENGHLLTRESGYTGQRESARDRAESVREPERRSDAYAFVPQHGVEGHEHDQGEHEHAERRAAGEDQ